MDRLTVDELLRRRIGLDPASIGPGIVARATRTRMKALGIAETDLAGYQDLINRSEAELQALVEEVVIPESWFFRDQNPFSLLADRATEGWISSPSRPPLRALSIPCAGGEEAYSIAIALIDRGLPPRRFHVDAVDVSRAALEVARRGVYSRNAFRSSDLTFRDGHFQSTPGGYALSAEVKAAVGFTAGNLLDPLLLNDRPGYDVIFCRNLLIYFDDDARQRAMANLDRLLVPTGLLFLGHAEHLGSLRSRFRSVADRKCFAFERRHPQTTEPDSQPVLKRPHHPPKHRPAPRAHRPVPKMTESPVSQPPIVKEGPLVEAVRLANEGRHDEAAALCEREIGRGGVSATPYYLLGVIRQAAGNRESAERSFEKAVYLDPTHEDALLALSLLVQRRGDLAAAAGYRRRAERAYQEKHRP